MPTILLPRQLAQRASGNTRIDINAENMQVLITKLCDEHPSLREVLLDGKGRISSFIGVFIDGRQLGGDTTLSEVTLEPDNSIQLVAAIAGG
ncbi:hypothetical protein [Undibacterium terreum]|uniref:Ubiquitin-like domain-containing protein n=1 Tax=Undibacterium terreum TaxID=1224302 RepID=A0A916UW84_9BURK|nr:hypothetical protein [Undibacterium terreum]GGC90745.1 hypothetical protein GCM10011396_42500 [Undibacterium terreum]